MTRPWPIGLALALCACDTIPSSDDELGGSTDSSSTDSSDSTDSGSTDSSDSTDSTDTGGDTGFLDGDPLCPSANWVGDEVVAARALFAPNSVLAFVRADGSSFVVREDFGYAFYSASGTGEHVVVARSGECAWESHASLYLRETGEPMWEDVLLPSVAEQAKLLANGRVVARGGRCEVADPFFSVVDETGVLLDDGEGDPRGLRDDDWLGIYRPLYEQDTEPEEHWRWRNVTDGSEFGPSFPIDSRAEFLGGRLVYGSVLDGGFMMVIEAPDSEPMFVDHPAFDALESAGWTFSVTFDDPWRHTSTRTLVLATSPGLDNRLFVMLDDVLDELPLIPPPGFYGLNQPEPLLDTNNHPLMTWRTASSAWLWRGVGETWTKIGPEIAGFDWLYAWENAGTVRLNLSENELDIEVWEPNPNALTGNQNLYVRDQASFVVPLDTTWHTQSPTGHCVAYSSNEWRIHDIETNQAVGLPEPVQSTFMWLE